MMKNETYREVCPCYRGAYRSKSRVHLVPWACMASLGFLLSTDTSVSGRGWVLQGSGSSQTAPADLTITNSWGGGRRTASHSFSATTNGFDMRIHSLDLEKTLSCYYTTNQVPPFSLAFPETNGCPEASLKGWARYVWAGPCKSNYTIRLKVAVTAWALADGTACGRQKPGGEGRATASANAYADVSVCCRTNGTGPELTGNVNIAGMATPRGGSVTTNCYCNGGTWNHSTDTSHTDAPSNAGSFGWSVVFNVRYDKVYVFETGGARPEVAFYAHFSADNACQTGLPTSENCALADLHAHAHSYFVNTWVVAYFE